MGGRICPRQSHGTKKNTPSLNDYGLKGLWLRGAFWNSASRFAEASFVRTPWKDVTNMTCGRENSTTHRDSNGQLEIELCPSHLYKSAKVWICPNVPEDLAVAGCCTEFRHRHRHMHRHIHRHLHPLFAPLWHRLKGCCPSSLWSSATRRLRWQRRASFML